MIEPIVVTVFPVVFLVVLFGGGALWRRRGIDMGGVAPIDKRLFLFSKYLMIALWGTMVVQSWGIRLSFLEVPGWLRGVCLVLWVGGFMGLFLGRLGLADSFRIGSPRENTRLKVGGLFRFSRNPMYVSVYTILLACALYTLNPLVLAGGAFVVVVHHRIVLAEEQHLQKAFGAEYAAYCGRVRRYL